MSHVGVKESKEALVAVLAVAQLIASRLKDGADGADAVAVVSALLGNEELKAKLAAAQEGIALIPAELKELDASEVVELLGAALPEVLKVVQALKA